MMDQRVGYDGEVGKASAWRGNMGGKEGTRRGWDEGKRGERVKEGDRWRRQCDLTWPRCNPFRYFPPHGQVAQLVEQRTENPRVGGSIPSLAITCNPTCEYVIVCTGHSDGGPSL